MTRWLMLVLIFVLAGCAGIGQGDPAAQAPTATPIPTAPALARPTYVVQRGTVQEVLEFSGRWSPRDQMRLAFEINGTIRQVNVRRGDTVTTRQLLADYQITELESQRATAQLELQNAHTRLNSGAQGGAMSAADAQIALANAQLALESTRAGSPWASVETARIGVQSAETALETARRDFDEARSHADRPAGEADAAYQAVINAEAQLRSAQAGYDSAAQGFNAHQIQIAQAENAVIQAQINLDEALKGSGNIDALQAVEAAQLRIDQIDAQIRRSSLYSPLNGVVLEVTIKPGDQVEAYKTVITVGLPEPKEAIANLAFNDAQRLNVNTIGICQIANQPASAVQCIVRQIPASAQDADQTTRVAASLQGAAEGQLIEVQMPVQVRENVLWLPPVAVRTFQGRTFVVLVTPDGPRRADVQIGLQTDERVEIIAGVSAGDVVEGP